VLKSLGLDWPLRSRTRIGRSIYGFVRILAASHMNARGRCWWGAFLNKGLDEIHAVLSASISPQSNVAKVALLIVSIGPLAVYGRVGVTLLVASL